MQIAVIGAGIAGLTTAYRLQQRGHAVTLFEKNLYPGGKCLSIPTSTGFSELGCVFGVANSNSLKRLLNELNINFNLSYFYQNFSDNFGKIISLIPAEHIQEIKFQYNRLPQVLLPYSKFLSDPGMNNVNSEISMPFSRWCVEHGLSLLPLVFAPQFTGFGYGKLDEVPAAYVLKNLDITALSSFGRPSKHITFKNGTKDLCLNIASKLKDIRYNQNVSYISGGYQPNVITQTGSYSFDAVVLTTPLPDCCDSSFHVNLMQKYIYTSYSVFLYRTDILPNTNIYFPSAFEPDSSRRLMLIYSPSITGCSGVFNCYCNGDYNIPLCTEEIEQELELAGINKTSLLAYRQGGNFPHVDSSNISNGFYEDLANNQGKSGIYLGGALSAFSSFERIIQFVDYFVNEYF